MNHKSLPADLTPLHIKAYLFNAFGACGCWEMDLFIAELKRILEWHSTVPRTEDYDMLYPDHAGAFYMWTGVLNDLELTNHGTSARYGWLTDEGRRLLAALQKITPEEIEKSSGEVGGVWWDEL